MKSMRVQGKPQTMGYFKESSLEIDIYGTSQGRKSHFQRWYATSVTRRDIMPGIALRKTFHVREDTGKTI